MKILKIGKEEKVFLNIAEVCKILNKSYKDVLHLLKEGKLPGIKYKRKWYIEKDKFLSLIKSKIKEG